MELLFMPSHKQPVLNTGMYVHAETVQMMIMISRESKGTIIPRKKLKQQLASSHKQIGLLGQPSWKFDYIVKDSPPNYHAHPLTKPTPWTTDNSQDVYPNPPKNPKPRTPPTIFPCYRQAQKWMKQHG